MFVWRPGDGISNTCNEGTSGRRSRIGKTVRQRERKIQRVGLDIITPVIGFGAEIWTIMVSRTGIKNS